MLYKSVDIFFLKNFFKIKALNLLIKWILTTPYISNNKKQLKQNSKILQSFSYFTLKTLRSYLWIVSSKKIALKTNKKVTKKLKTLILPYAIATTKSFKTQKSPKYNLTLYKDNVSNIFKPTIHTNKHFWVLL
jgi:hypothetical protein